MLYMPVEKDSMLLVDGGLTNNLPVDIAKAGGATLIIASDLSSPLRNKKEINAPWKVADQVMGIMMKSRLVEKRKEADILIRPDLGHFLPGEWDKIDFAIEQSYLTAVKVLRNNEKIAELKRENKNLYYWKICKYKIPKTEFINYIVNVTGNGPSSRDKSLLKQIYALMDSVKLLNSPLDEDLQRDIRTILVNSGYQYTKLSCGINGEILTIKLIDPKLESVVLHGLEKTKHLIIKRELELQPGEYLNYSKLLNSYYNVYNTNLFKSVGMNLMPGSADSLVSLNITVKEKKAGVFRLGLRYDNTRFARSFLDLSDQNTFGYGIRNKISVELGEMNRGIEIESNSDRLGYTNLSAGLNLYNRIRENRRYEGNEHKINYMDHRTGVTMWFGAEVEQIGLVKISWNYDRLMSRYDSLYADRNLEFYRLGLTSMEDKRDSRIFPTRGTFNQWRLETGHYVETSSTSYTYIKFFLHLSKWYSLTTNNAFGGYLQTGISDINVPYENFFEWGGWDKMPGYVDREKAGRNFWLLRLDYRYRLVIDLPPDIYFHLAAAAGKSNLSPDDYLNFTQIVTGFEAGVSLKTFFGPIQLFYGWNSDKIQRVYFNAGFPF
jgi:outer membrane protein assembly factor BamA